MNKVRPRLGMSVSIMALGCMAPCSLSADPGASEPLDVADLQARVARLADRVEELAGTHDLLDTLHFGWFDRPYARATLAVVVKTTSAVKREIRLRRRGNGAIADASLRAMVLWAEKALDRASESEVDVDFRPHRLRVTDGDLGGTPSTPAFFAFVDRATSTRLHPAFGDLDLAAAIGSRVYPRLDRELGTADKAALRASRASALGMATIVLISTTDQRPERRRRVGKPRAGAWGSDKHGMLAHGDLVVEPLSLRELLGPISGLTGKPRRSVAIVDPPAGESWASSLVRRALARGTLNQTRYVATGWTSPIIRGLGDGGVGAVEAAMWVDAIDGQSLGLLPGWRDLRDGSGSLYASILTDPARMETIAHTALDLIRLGRYMVPLRAVPGLVVTVGPEAVDPEDDNAWARWIEPVWSALHQRQIRFDVVGTATRFADPASRYPVVLPLRREHVSELPSLLLSVERKLARHAALTLRVTARELDEQLATDVFIRNGQAPGARACVAVVNLSNRPRKLLLKSPVKLGTTVDVVSGQRIADSQAPLPMSPWQVQVLWPTK